MGWDLSISLNILRQDIDILAANKYLYLTHLVNEVSLLLIKDTIKGVEKH